MSPEEYSSKNKKKTSIWIIGFVIILITAVSVTFFYNSTAAYAIKVENKLVGIVKQKQDIENVINKLTAEAENKYGREVKPQLNLTYEKMKGFDVEISTEQQLVEKLKPYFNYKVEAVNIIVDGKSIVTVKDKASAQKVIEEVKETFSEKNENVKTESVEIQEDIEFEPVFADPEDIVQEEKAVNILLRGTDEIKVHEVKKGESLWLIAHNNRMTVKDLKKANPQVQSEILQIGQKLNLVVPKPYLNVLTVEEKTYNRAIPYTTKIEYDRNMWTWEQKVKQRGVYGTKEVTAKIYKENGKEIKREIIEEKVLKEPVERILIRGTKAAPSRGTGRFIWPATGRISSPFGPRGREFHTGVDIAAPYNTPIKAADSGTVTFAGWQGGYGRLVIVSHGNGFETYYAHTNKILVKVGEAVEKGEKIALVGSSGRSTGPHLHFEIRKNGKPLNPLNYFEK
ncbi:MAG: hypothetical protein PWP21_598 [Thermosediminibacterales bacterium]|nr:hypothetical protein [Thermosediminibacterales bacterium]